MADIATTAAPPAHRPTREELGFRHPEWQAGQPLWKFTRDQYTAAVLRPDLIMTYLRQKKQGETDASFKERCDCADFTNHFGTVVDSLVGMLGQVEDDASRTWGRKEDGATTVSGLGDPADPDSAAARLWRDADGRGTSWLTFWSGCATELSLTHVGWLMVDARSEDEDPVVRYLDPECVVNWREEDGRLVEVVIMEEADARTSVWQKPVPVRQFLHLTLDGWTRYQVARDKDDTVTVAGEPGLWGTPYQDDAGNACLPIRRLVLPMKRAVGYYLAKKSNAIFNRESERDHLLRVANFPKLNVKGDDTVYQAVVDALKKGNNVLQGDGHQFIAPDTSSATLATEVNKEKARELYITGFREYGDAAQQRTATEVKQDVAAGAAAYLTLLARTLDQAETWAMHLLTQLEVPNQEDAWFAAKVERSTNYAPADPDAVLDKLITRTFGPNVAVPMGRTAQENAAIQVADYLGLAADPEQLKAAVAARGLTDLMAAGLSLPAQARVLALVGWLEAGYGRIDPKATVQMADGTSRNLQEVIVAEATAIAEAEDEATKLGSQTFTLPPLAAPAPQDAAA